MKSSLTIPSISICGVSASSLESQLRGLVLRSRAVRGDDVVIEGLKLPGGNVRADVVVVNDAVSGFLIQGAHANTGVLAKRVLAYDRFFRYSNILTVPEHLDGVGELVPDSWGIWVALGHGRTVRLRCVRPAFVRCGREPVHVAGLLTREECRTQLAARGLARGGSKLSKAELAMRLARALPIPFMDAYLAACLKRRFDQAIQWWSSSGASAAPLAVVGPGTLNLGHLARVRLQAHQTVGCMGAGVVPGPSTLDLMARSGRQTPVPPSR